MAQLVTDCPRCNARKITFDMKSVHVFGKLYSWQQWYEVFCICRHCRKSTTFVLSDADSASLRLVQKQGLLAFPGSVNQYVRIEGTVSLKDSAACEPPEHLPENVERVFREAATCLAVGCNNAAGTMFRLCIDLVTKEMLPEDGVNGLNVRVRRNLGLRLPWMFDNDILPENLRELSTCVREDGNDGAHSGTLTREDTEDLLDFTSLLLKRIYTEPERLRLAGIRRDKRRGTEEISADDASETATES